MTGSGPVHPGPRDLMLLARHALDGTRVTGCRPLSGGFSTDNILLCTDDGTRFVLRGYPRRNTCAMEAALARRLSGQVPVPEVVFADAKGELLGWPVLVSRFVPGRRADAALARTGEADGRQLAVAIGETLGRIGALTFDQPGFFDGPDLCPRTDADSLTSSLPRFVEHCLRHGNAGAGLTPAEQDGLRQLAIGSDPLVQRVAGARSLVHSDFNGKNILVDRDGAGSWQVTAVLDWEFAFSGCPLVDVANMLRFPGELPPGFDKAFSRAFRASGGDLPSGWWETSRALDLFALADFLTRPPDHPFFARAVALIRERLRQSTLLPRGGPEWRGGLESLGGPDHA